LIKHPQDFDAPLRLAAQRKIPDIGKQVTPAALHDFIHLPHVVCVDDRRGPGPTAHRKVTPLQSHGAAYQAYSAPYDMLMSQAYIAPYA
jgi:hypothetical protein